MANFYNKDLYKILGVTKDASLTEIKVAFRTQARKYHPDVSSNPKDTEKFKELKAIYDILSDAEKRKKYDILYSYYHDKTINGQSIKDFAKNKKEQYSTSHDSADENLNDENSRQDENIDDDFASKFSNVMNTLFSGDDKKDSDEKQKTKNKNNNSDNGKDIFMDISITVNEALEGTNRIVNILHSEVCPNCGGKKFINGSSCIMCQGTGEISIYKKLNVKIPAGILNGSKIKIKSEGNTSPSGEKNGDLYLNVIVQHSDLFKYENLNIICEVPISPVEAVLGATIQIPTPQGTFKMKVPPMTNSGQKFRIAGEGLVDTKNNTKGDVIVTVIIKLPPSYTDEEIKHYKQLKKLSNYNMREGIENV